MYCKDCGKEINIGDNYCPICGEYQHQVKPIENNIDHCKMAKYVRLCVIAMLLLALISLPYGYYILLRWVVTVTAGYIAYLAYIEKRQLWITIFIFIAIIFNPIVPIYLDRQIWSIINVIVVIFMLFSILFIPAKKRGNNGEK